MNWYAAEDQAKSVREIVIEVPQPRPVPSKFGMLLLGDKYHPLRTSVWTAGLFRIDDDAGPYLMVRADRHAARLKDQPFRVAFCFYRMRAGGLIAIFVDFPGLEIAKAPSAPFVLFEMIRGIDVEDERQRVGDAIGRPQLHLCFAEGDGPGEEIPGLGWTGSPINAAYDVVVDVDGDCRAALQREWTALLDYHRLIGSRRDFRDSVQQMERENPLTRNPVVDRSPMPGTAPPTVAAEVAGRTDRKWWRLWR